MPRIASGDGMDEEPTPAAPSTPSRSYASQSLGVSSGGRWGEGGVRGVGEGDEVVGMKGRRRLPLASSSALNPSASPSASLRISTFAIERTRKEIIAEEYLTHVGEALQWVEGVLQEDLGLGVVEFEERLRDGVVLAKIAKQLDGLKKGEKIFEVRFCFHTHSSLHFQH